MTVLRDMWRRLYRQPLRTGLIMFQFILTSSTVLLALTLNTNQRLDQAQEQVLFTLVAGYRNQNFSSSNALFKLNDLDELRALAPAVKSLALYDQQVGSTVIAGGQRYKLRATAVVSSNYLNIDKVRITSGTGFTDLDAAMLAPVMLLSRQAAKELFGTLEPIGQELGVSPVTKITPTSAAPTRFTIVGVFDSKYQPFSFRDAVAFFPAWASPQNALFSAPFEASRLVVQAFEGQGQEARTQIVTAARAVYNKELRVRDTEEGSDFYVESFLNPLGSTSNFQILLFQAFGLVAMTIGSIGVFSVSLVSTVERQGELALRRALGASRSRILLEQASEIAIIAAIGTIIGVGIVLWLLPIINNTLSLFKDLTFPPIILLVVVFITTLLLASGLCIFPVFRLIRVWPAEALKEN